MNCPPELAAVILEIIQTALLTVRASGWSGNPEECARQADHVHNLPALLANYSPDLLRYYWEAERPSFISQCPGSAAAFEPLWQRLKMAVDKMTNEPLLPKKHPA
jgi:hypothetical protein